MTIKTTVSKRWQTTVPVEICEKLCFMRYGRELAHRAYPEVTLLPIEVIESDEDQRVSAAELKANYNISVANAGIGATARKLNAVLVHKDPEYEALKYSIKCMALS